MLVSVSKRFCLTTMVCAAIVAAIGQAAVADNLDLPRYPSISPNGSAIVFSWRGDLWQVPSSGGTALRLTSHPQDDLHSAWSDCGTMIAFNSTRDGYLNIWLMDADGTNIRQVTHSDRSCHLAGFGKDADGNAVITFSGSLEADVYRSARPYMVKLDGGDMMRAHDAFGEHPMADPNGKTITFTRGGNQTSWQRRHYRGADQKDIWLYERDEGSFTQLTTWAGNDGNAKWADERSLVYMSDRELNTVNLYRMNIADGEEAALRLTDFDERDVHDFDISADGKTAVMLVWDTLYTLDLANQWAKPEPITIVAAEDDRDNYEVKSVAREVSSAALSPDGQVMAYIAYGRVYVRNVDDKSPSRRVVGDSHARHRDVAWSPDGVTLYFASDEDGTESIYAATVNTTRSELRDAFEDALKVPEEIDDADERVLDDKPDNDAGDDADDVDRDVEVASDDSDEAEADDVEDAEEDLPDPALDPKRWHDAVRFDIQPAVQTTHHDRMPSPSPDGRRLAFHRGRGDLMILDLHTGEVRRLVEGWDSSLHWRWSPDGSRIAYAQNDLNFSSNIFIVDVDGESAPANITRHPRNDMQPRWSADGRVLAFLSNRTDSSYDVWMVYLDRDLEALTPKELDAYYEEASKRASRAKPLPIAEKKRAESIEAMTRPTLHLEDAWLRLKRITSFPNSDYQLEMTPAADRLIFTADIDGRALYSIKWDGSDRKRLTGNVNVQHVTPTGDKVVFVSSGRAGTVPPNGGSADYVDITDRLRIDLQAQSSQKFMEAARTLGEAFYHNEMKGLDWERLTEEYHALAKQARTADEFNYVSNRFLGELSASHLGVRASDPPSPLRESLGRLGTIHHRVILEDGTHGFAVTEVVPQSPAEIGTMALVEGDIITAIEFKPFSETDTVESRLRGRVGDETIVTILRETDAGDRIELHTLLTPISYGAYSQLRYRQWRLRNAEIVDRMSDGRIGYIHIQSMNQSSLDVYERDLYAAAGDKDGLIIDVRSNGGGWTTDRLLASIMTREHAYTSPRGAPQDATGHYPQDRLFIQRYTLPINMLCNEKSFSNAEIISHAFKTLERGTLVGQETHGSVISTGGFSLIDGTRVRLPFRGWYTLDGTDMENNGAVPDIRVPQMPHSEATGEDEQLRAAVEDLLQRLP